MKNRLFMGVLGIVILFSIISFVFAQGMLGGEPVSIVDPIGSNGAVLVNVQNQITPPVDFFFAKAIGSITNLTNNISIDDTNITIGSTTNFIDGTYVGIFSTDGERFYFAEQIGAPVGNVIILDTPIDFDFTAGSIVIPLTRNLNVDGSSTSQIFIISGGQGDFEIDITRLMISFITDSTVSLSKFGDIPKLTRGVVLRRTDGDTRNIWNIKDNGEIANICFDYQPYEATNPSQGQDGAKFRCTFAGQEKHGVVIRLSTGDRLELIIQDDLTGITQFRVMAEGHIVQD